MTAYLKDLDDTISGLDRLCLLLQRERDSNKGDKKRLLRKVTIKLDRAFNALEDAEELMEVISDTYGSREENSVSPSP
jgi:hypothetical protein